MTDTSQTGGVVVVGAASALGAAVARRLAPRYAGVLLADRDAAPLHALAGELRCGGRPALCSAGDLGDEQLAQRAIDQATAELGKVVVLVNVLARPRAAALLSSEAPPWDETLDQTIRSLYSFTRPAVRAMRESGTAGRVVTVSSRSWLGEADESAFSAAAGAVAGFTRALSLEVGRFGVTVNALACAYIDTPEWRQAQPEQVARAERATSVRRAGQPGEVAAFVDFLASAEAAFVTGQVIAVCGGSSVGKSTY